MTVRQLAALLRDVNGDAEVWIAVLDSDGDEESQLPVTDAGAFGDRFMVGAGETTEGEE
jgi:hypothetical protein